MHPLGVMLELDSRVWAPVDAPDLAGQGWWWLLYYGLLALIPTFVFALFTIFLLTLLVTGITNGHVNEGLANTLPWIAILGFLGWVGSALVFPLGAGGHFASSVGARRPTREEQQAYEDALAALQLPADVRRPAWMYVLDSHELNAAVAGDVLILNRSLFESGFLAAVLAHELGHLNSMDARVSVAVNRLAGPARATVQLRRTQTTAFLTGSSLSFPINLVILVIRGCAGGLATDAMIPAWSAWWRLREHVADSYAARLGQGEQLATFLQDHALLYDIPIKRIWMSDEGHPPVAQRIERLREQAAGTGKPATSEQQQRET
jgi:Zn-dependent protease with chaperone function